MFKHEPIKIFKYLRLKLYILAALGLLTIMSDYSEAAVVKSSFRFQMLTNVN